MKRRRFLAATGLTGLAGLAVPVIAGCGSARSGVSAPQGPLHVPPLLSPPPGADGVRRFRLDLAPGQTEFLPGTKASTWGVNGSYLGPTLRASRGDRVAMQVVNGLPEETTLHWHGMRLPAEMDGGPHQTIAPGTAWTPEWTIDQPAFTGWYHPHPHGRTALHIYRGVAGLFLVDDAEETGLPGGYGVDDIPLIIQDRAFTADGSLDESGLTRGRYGFTGTEILVNGTHRPLLHVEAARVRFRLLNASHARVYRVGFADGRRFHLVATDSGLLPAPIALDRVKLSPGERAEVVVDFAPGERVTLNSVGERSEDAAPIEKDDLDLLTITAAERLAPAPPLPSRLPGAPPVVPPSGARVRTFTLGGDEINGRGMDMGRIDEVVPAGATEIWEVRNTTFAHNFHVHATVFTVLDVDGRPPAAQDTGPKDTVFVPGNTTVRIAVAFSEYTDPVRPYMYHCHILRHEDQGMMGQFVVVQPGTEDQAPRRVPGTTTDRRGLTAHRHGH